jgi:hypothetical protein
VRDFQGAIFLSASTKRGCGVELLVPAVKLKREEHFPPNNRLVKPKHCIYYLSKTRLCHEAQGNLPSILQLSHLENSQAIGSPIAAPPYEAEHMFTPNVSVSFARHQIMLMREETV